MPMLNGYSPESLEKITTLHEVIKYRLGRNRDEIRQNLSTVSYAISDPNFDFPELKVKQIGAKFLFSTDSINDHLALKALDRSIRSIYQVKFSDKSSIVKCMITALNDSSLNGISRIDFKSFFENIPRAKLIKKLIDDSILSQELLSTLIKIDRKLDNEGYSGLPRGLSISSTLSELYLRDFDRHMKSHWSTYYYARYVDDIVLISKSQEHSAGELYKRTEELRIDLNLEKNYQEKDLNEFSFDYLGFKFEKLKEKLSISISDKKMSKIKTRIVKAILSFGKNKNSELLKKRILFLTSNHRITINGEISDLKSGIYYTNSVVNKFQCLSELDTFLRKSFTSKKPSFSNHLKTLKKETKDEILKMSFFKGFIDKKTIHLQKDDYIKIKECWNDEKN